MVGVRWPRLPTSSARNTSPLLHRCFFPSLVSTSRVPESTTSSWRREAGCQSWYKPSGISVTIVLCAGNVAERRAVWPHASVDALSTGKSISTNCEPPSGAAAKRTIFIRALRNGALLGAGVAISPRFAALGQAVPPRGKESRDETWRRATLYRCRCWWESSRHTRIRADGGGDRYQDLAAPDHVLGVNVAS